MLSLNNLYFPCFSWKILRLKDGQFEIAKYIGIVSNLLLTLLMAYRDQ